MLARSGSNYSRPTLDLAHRQLRNRFLGQEPLRRCARRTDRRRQPLRSRGGWPYDCGGVANAYFQVLAAQDRLRVARENLASATRVLNLIKQRLQAGTASALDTAQQESLVNNQRAAIPPLEQTLRQNRVALAVLMGRSPESVKIRGGSLRSIAYPRVTPGLPSELVARSAPTSAKRKPTSPPPTPMSRTHARNCCPSITLTGEGGYRERDPANFAAAGIGVFHAHGRPDPADLRRRTTARQSRPAEGQAGRASADLPQGGDFRLCRCRECARRYPPRLPSAKIFSATW